MIEETEIEIEKKVKEIESKRYGGDKPWIEVVAQLEPDHCEVVVTPLFDNEVSISAEAVVEVGKILLPHKYVLISVAAGEGRLQLTYAKMDYYPVKELKVGGIE